MDYASITKTEAKITTEKGIFVTHNNGKTWEKVSDKISLSAAINGMEVLADDTGIYFVDKKSTNQNYTKVLDNVDAVKLIACKAENIFNQRPVTGNKSIAYLGKYGDLNKNYSTKGNTFFLLVTKTAIYTSQDGVSWYMETNGRFDRFITKDYKCYGESGVYNVLNEEYLHLKKITVTKDMNQQQLDNLLLYVLNKIYLPMVSYYNTGLTVFLEGEGYALTNEENKIAMSGNDVYAFSEFSSLIDWKSDVGMFSFDGITMSDLVENDSLVQGEKTFFVENNEKVANAINYVKNFYNKKKQVLLENCSSKLEKLEPEDNYAEKLNNLNYEIPEEKANAFEMYRDYVQAAKGGALEVYNKFLEATHYLDDYRAKKVITAAIYETIMAMAPKTKGLIADAKTEAEKKDISVVVDLSKVNWDYDYGLNQAYKKYMKYIRNNFMQLRENGDKEIIGVAALYYRTETRENILNKLNEKLLQIDLSKELTEHYSELVKEMNDYTSGKSIVVPSTDIPKDIVKVYNRLLKNKIIYYINSFDYPEFKEDETYINLEAPEKERALKYLKEIYAMFKKRILDYTDYINKKYPVNVTNTIDSDFINWKNGDSEFVPNWRSEFNRLGIELRDSIVYNFISEEDKI